MKRLAILAALAALAPGAAYAAVDVEKLLIEPPPGFYKAYWMVGTKGFSVGQFLPEGETPQNWTAQLTAEVLRHDKEDGDAYAETVRANLEQSCATCRIERRDAGTTNGYPWVVWYFECSTDPTTKKPQTSWLKAIRGTDALFAMWYDYSGPPKPEYEAPTLAHLATVSLCDPTRPGHPCPAGQ